MNFSRGFFKGQRLRWRNIEYVVEKRLGNRHIELKNVLTAASIVEQDKALAQYFFTGELVCLDQTSGKAASETRATRILEANFADLPEVLRIQAKRRFSYVKALLSAGLDQMVPETVLPIIDKVAIELNDTKPPSFISVWRWKKKYLCSSGNIRSLAENRLAMGNHLPKVQPEVKIIINEAIKELYLSKVRHNGAVVCARVETRVAHENRSRRQLNSSDPGVEPMEMLRQPSKTTVYHHLRQLDPYERDCARLGERLANLKYHAYKKGPRPERALQRMELDHTFMPVILLDTQQWIPIGRPNVTLAFDKHTDNPLGMHVGFESPSYVSIAKCIRNAVRPKSYVQELYPKVQNSWNTYGVAETAFCDDGRDFWSEDLEDACLQMGTILEYAPSKHPWWKASIERHFRTVKTELVHRLPGAKLTKLLEDTDYNPQKDAVLSLSSFMEILHIWLIDVYMQTPRKGRTISPAAAWDLAVEKHPPTLPPNPRDLDIFLFKYAERYLQCRGVEYAGLLYNSPELMGLRRILQQLPHRPKVKIKIDPDDLSCVYVQDPKTKSYVVAPAIDQSYTKDMTMWHHQIIKNQARLDHKGAIDIDKLCQARDRIQAIVQREWLAGISKGSRKLSYRWLNGFPAERTALGDKESRLADQPDALIEEQAGSANINSQTWAGIARFSDGLLPRDDNQERNISLVSTATKTAADDTATSLHSTAAKELPYNTGSHTTSDSSQDALDCSGWTSSKRRHTL